MLRPRYACLFSLIDKCASGAAQDGYNYRFQSLTYGLQS